MLIVWHGTRSCFFRPVYDIRLLVDILPWENKVDIYELKLTLIYSLVGSTCM